jgi:hypothetical protein
MHLWPLHSGADHCRSAAGGLAHQAEAVAARSGDVEPAHRPATADAHRDGHNITRWAAALRPGALRWPAGDVRRGAPPAACAVPPV